jgi:hypothetical protein
VAPKTPIESIEIHQSGKKRNGSACNTSGKRKLQSSNHMRKEKPTTVKQIEVYKPQIGLALAQE